MTRKAWIALWVSFGVSVPHRAAAEEPERHEAKAAEEEARSAMRRGLAASARGNLEEALKEFLRASELVPDANLPYRHAGEALASLGRSAEAVRMFETYLSRNPQVRDAEAVRARIEALKVPPELSIGSNPPGALVYLDGQFSGRTPLALRVRGGQHRVKLFKDGFFERHLVASAVPGKNNEAFAELEPKGQKPLPKDPRFVTWGWVGVGAGTVVVLSALALDVAVLGPKIDAFEKARGVDAAEALRHKDAATTLQIMTGVGYGLGGALTLAGAGLLLFGPRTGIRAALGPSGIAVGGSM